MKSSSARRFARRWGYEVESGEFVVRLYETAPKGQYGLSAACDGESGKTDTEASGGDEIRVSLRASDGSDVTASLSYNGTEVDAMWVKVRLTKCPHCGGELDWG